MYSKSRFFRYLTPLYFLLILFRWPVLIRRHGHLLSFLKTYANLICCLIPNSTKLPETSTSFSGLISSQKALIPTELAVLFLFKKG